MVEVLKSSVTHMKAPSQRTPQQNKSIHMLFDMLAFELNAGGLDMRVVLKPEIAIPWTAESVKENLWRPFQRAMYQKESTAQLTTVELQHVFETLNRHLGEKFGLHVPFPSLEEVMKANQKE